MTPHPEQQPSDTRPTTRPTTPSEAPPPPPPHGASPRRAAPSTRLRGIVLTVIGVAGIIGGVLFATRAPHYTPVPVVFLTFWLVMVIVGRILFTGLGDLRTTGTASPAPEQLRGAAAVAAIIIGTGLLGFAATTAGTGTAHAICPGDATCPPAPGPTLTFTPPTAGGGHATTGAPDTGTNQRPTATSPTDSDGNTGDNIHAHTPQFGTPGQQAPDIPGNQPTQQPQPQQSQQGHPGQRRSPVQLTPTQQPPTSAPATASPTTIPTASPASSSPSPSTVTVTQTHCPLPGTSGPGNPVPGAADPSSIGPDNTNPDGGSGGAPSWAYLVAEATAVMTGRRRGRKAGPRNADGTTPTSTMIPGELVDGDDYTLWTTPDGDRTFILSENADAPSRYRFDLNQPPGGSSTVNDDGSVAVYDREGNQVNHFRPPWAYDTITGRKIPTHYSIDGDDLIQTIDRPAGNNNPILADPDPDQAAAALRKLADQGNPLAQQMAPLTQPAAPDPAQMLQHGLDQQEQQSVTDAIAQPYNATQQPELPIDPPYSTPAEDLPTRRDTSSKSEDSSDGFWSTVGTGTKNFGAGVGRGLADFGSGLWHLIRHPVDTAKGMAPLVGLGGDGAPGVGQSWKAVGKSILAWDDFARGDYAYGTGKALLNILTAVVGTKGLGAAGKIRQASRAGEAAEDLAKAADKATPPHINWPGDAKGRGQAGRAAAADAAKAPDEIPKTSPIHADPNYRSPGAVRTPDGLGMPSVIRPLYDTLRPSSPSVDARTIMEGVKPTTPSMSKQFPTVPLRLDPRGLPRVDLDHVVPLAEIVQLPRFAELTWNNMLAVANHIPNFEWMANFANASKGTLSYAHWGGLKGAGIPLDPTVKAAGIAMENALRAELSKTVLDLLAGQPAGAVAAGRAGIGQLLAAAEAAGGLAALLHTLTAPGGDH